MHIPVHPFAHMTNPSCNTFQTYLQIFLVVTQVLVGSESPHLRGDMQFKKNYQRPIGNLVMRTSAIYERSRFIRITLTITVMITIGTGIVGELSFLYEQMLMQCLQVVCDWLHNWEL